MENISFSRYSDECHLVIAFGIMIAGIVLIVVGVNGVNTDYSQCDEQLIYSDEVCRELLDERAVEDRESGKGSIIMGSVFVVFAILYSICLLAPLIYKNRHRTETRLLSNSISENVELMQNLNIPAELISGIKGYFKPTIMNLILTGKIVSSAFLERSKLLSIKISSAMVRDLKGDLKVKVFIENYSKLTHRPNSQEEKDHFERFEHLWKSNHFSNLPYLGSGPLNAIFSSWVISLDIDTPFYKNLLDSKNHFKNFKELVLYDFEYPTPGMFQFGLKHKLLKKYEKLMKKNKLSKAEELIITNIKRDPIDPVDWLNLGRIYLQMKDYSNSKLALRFSLACDPYNEKVWEILSSIQANGNSN